MQKNYDVVIIGGGVIGSSIAYFLTRNSALSVLVVERDPTYSQASSALSASSIRQQFTTPLNVQMSQFGFDFLTHISDHLAVEGEPVDIGFIRRGYLVLAPGGHGAGLRKAAAAQRALGAHTCIFEREDLAVHYPWLQSADLDLASYGSDGEGWFDGYGVLQAFRRKARAAGVEYIADRVTALESTGGRVTRARCASGAAYVGEFFVNAAGPQAADLCRQLGIELPVSARKRDVFVFDCAEKLIDVPMVFDPTGVWFRPEGEGFICGKAPDADNDPPDAPLDRVDYGVFDEVIWPVLAQRVTAFEAVKIRNAWAGYYAMNLFDHNAILGPHPEFSNFLLANGFSGHGMQQSPAVGRGLAELIEHGAYQTLDLTPFAFERIAAGQPIIETVVY